MKSIILSISALGLLLLTACGQYLYKSPSVKTPLFTKQHDIQGQVSMGGAGSEVYLAYAPLNNLGFSAAYAGYREEPDTFNLNRAGTFSDFEISAIPYYSKEIMRVEMPIGVGLTRFNPASDSLSISSPYTRMFAQPTFGLSYENLDFAFFVRITSLGYSNPLYGRDTRYEPGIMLRVGHENVKIMGQFRLDNGTNYSKRPGTPLSIYQQIEYLPFHLSLGVTFQFNGAAISKKTEVKK